MSHFPQNFKNLFLCFVLTARIDAHKIRGGKIQILPFAVQLENRGFIL